ncbi:MAG: hypothetical protein GX434_04435 [Peptococcaceae bacterium]|nr:hypothetical protein [Peptococcaceae bacterium]
MTKEATATSKMKMPAMYIRIELLGGLELWAEFLLKNFMWDNSFLPIIGFLLQNYYLKI